MEHTFFQPRVRIEKRESEERTGNSGNSQPDPVTGTAPGQTAQATAQVRTIAFQPREMAALSQLDLSPTGTELTDGVTSFRLHVGETPAEFAHLYAGLERIVNKVGDVSMITGNLLETERPYILGVTSAVAGEGKTTTALHLAMTIARSTPKRVCLIDLSLGHNVLADRLGMPANGEGLVAAVEDNVDVVPCFNLPNCDNLMIVPSGRPPANPAKFVRMPRIAQFLIATRHAFDVVLIDMPPVTTENALPLARHTDGIIMVVRSGVTPRDVVAEALETVGTERINCVILNRAKPSAPKWLQRRYARV